MLESAAVIMLMAETSQSMVVWLLQLVVLEVLVAMAVLESVVVVVPLVETSQSMAETSLQLVLEVLLESAAVADGGVRLGRFDYMAVILLLTVVLKAVMQSVVAVLVHQRLTRL